MLNARVQHFSKSADDGKAKEYDLRNKSKSKFTVP